MKKTYGSLSRNNKWTLGSFSLSWPIIVILNYFVNVHWTSLRAEISKLQNCHPEMQWRRFYIALKIPATILLTVCYFLHQTFSSDNFLLNQTSSFINILQIIDRKLIFDKVFAPTTDTKALRAHLANIVDPFQSSWTNGKRFAYVSIVQWGSEVPSYTKIISLLKKSVFFETGC